jgi:YVTN family beta-propeller protein
MPWGVAVGGPAQETAYVTNFGADSVSFVDLDELRETTRVPVGLQPMGITIVGGSDLEELYTANSGDGTVSVIEVAPARRTFTIPIGGRPRGNCTTGPINGQIVLTTN